MLIFKIKLTIYLDCKLDKINLDKQDPLEVTVILVVHPYEKWYNYNKYNFMEGDGCYGRKNVEINIGQAG